jgi:hypothetical protein
LQAPAKRSEPDAEAQRANIPHVSPFILYIYNGSSWLVLGPPSPQQYLYPL